LFVVVAEFRIAPAKVEAFAQLIERQAHDSLGLEPGCRYFDICQGETDPERFVLYEVYESADAFQAHREYPHSKAFQEAIAPLVVERRVDRLIRREATA
jgi:quinol monooxygenase YgiN